MAKKERREVKEDKKVGYLSRTENHSQGKIRKSQALKRESLMLTKESTEPKAKTGFLLCFYGWNSCGRHLREIRTQIIFNWVCFSWDENSEKQWRMLNKKKKGKDNCARNFWWRWPIYLYVRVRVTTRLQIERETRRERNTAPCSSSETLNWLSFHWPIQVPLIPWSILKRNHFIIN